MRSKTTRRSKDKLGICYKDGIYTRKQFLQRIRKTYTPKLRAMAARMRMPLDKAFISPTMSSIPKLMKLENAHWDTQEGCMKRIHKTRKNLHAKLNAFSNPNSKEYKDVMGMVEKSGVVEK